MRTKKFTFAMLAALTLVFFVSCSEDRVTSSYETHPTNWMDQYSDEWHGTAALGSKGESCLGCHGSGTYTFEDPNAVYPQDVGPEVVIEQEEHLITCKQCHNYPHGENYVPQHFLDIRSANWMNMAECQACHGANFAGGRSGATCNECHTLAGGPAACNTCHGYPPTTTRPLGDRNPGAHDVHSRYACTECHNKVNGLDHIDALPADVEFDDARISTANGFLANYTSPSNCATWCHSDLHQGAPRVAVSWNTGQTFTQCRSCHQVPPQSEFHPTEGRCHFCHPNIDPNSNYNDANLIRFLPGDTLHVNGVINATFQGE
jgi:hypothetical protein